jgi:hypothetical protein
LLAEFNTMEADQQEPLQAMLRHIAAIDMATSLKFCSSKRGVEHQLVKHYFQKLTAIQTLLGSEIDTGSNEKAIEKLKKPPSTAGYAGNKDLTDIPVHFHDWDYTEDDKRALQHLSEIFQMAHLPPIEVVDAPFTERDGLLDEHTLVYSVDPGFPVRSLVLGQSKPAAMIWRDHECRPER